jgi:carboxymethylenebutenolidase
MNEMHGLHGLGTYPLPRRRLMMSGLISGFTLATTTVAAQAIHTDMAGIEAGENLISAADGGIPGYFARPHGDGPFPVVLVNEEIFGVHEYIKDTCRRLAKAGFMAVAPEIYARIADLSKMTDVGQIISNVIAKKSDAEAMSDMDAAVAWAAQNRGDTNRIGVTGFCRGGRNTWLYAEHNPNLKAAVAWYGPVAGPTNAIQPKTPTEGAAELKCPLLGLYGGQDQGIPLEQVRAAEKAAKAAGKIVEIVVYPDAGHGFHADYRPSYNEKDARDGWARMLAWFQKYGV